MASTHITKNPVFEALAIIQADIDKFPNPGDNLDFIQCRSLVRRGASQCRKSGCKQNERQRLASLYSEFQNMTECLDTHTFYEDMEYFIIYTHCSQHREAVCEAFKKWKDQRLAAPPSPQPACPGAYPTTYLPESPIESPLSSFDAVFSPAISQSSAETSWITLPDGLMCDEPASICDPEDEDEQLMRSITAETHRNEEVIRVDNSIQGNDEETATVSYRDQRFEYPGLGSGSPRRTRSMRDHSFILTKIQSHPSEFAMGMGTVYVLKYLKAEGFFKIGFSTICAEARLRQAKYCFRKSTEIIYESKTKFRGAYHAEQIIHCELWNNNIYIRRCEECGGEHREWFKASRSKIVQTVEKIERFLRMPSYIQHGGEWKLSDEAYKLANTMYGPKAINWRDGQGEDIATGRALDVIQENTPQQKAPAAPTRAFEENTKQEPAEETPTTATEETPVTPTRATKVMPINVRMEATSTADIKVNVQVLVGHNVSNPGEVDEPRTMVIPMRPKARQAGAGLVEG